MAVFRFMHAALAASLLVLAGGQKAWAGAASSAPGGDQAAKQPAAQSRQPGVAQPAAPPAHPALSLNAQAVLTNAQKAYDAGVANYRDGHLAAAKANFDFAVDLMLSSNLDIKGDAQLSEQFDHIIDAISSLEMAALKEGNGFAPPTEPAPVDVANDVTFPVDPNLKAAAQAELKTTQSDLPLVLNDYVASYINFFANTSKGHNTIVHSLTRAGRYKQMIQRVLAEEGVPQDLIYQAIAESGFQPQAVNGRSRAGGMWQFMPWSSYGLARTGWYDERFDPEKSTHAYARYIKSLYEQLGDWYLAMAAYDWGPGNVQRAVQRTGYADFWELYRRNNLPAETKNYVPIILAATIMAKNPKQYGLDTMIPDAAITPDNVTTHYAIDLRLVADVTNTPLEDVLALNPSLLRMSTPPDEAFVLHLPAGSKDLFEKRIAEIPEDKRRYWRFHKLVPGDTVESLAHTYRVSASEIGFVNQLASTTDLAGVEALVIPVAPVTAPSALRSARYRTRKGDTLVTVADRFGVTVEQLRRWNRMSGSQLTSGRTIFVSEPARVSSRSRASSKTTRRAAIASQSAKSGAGKKTTARAGQSMRKATASKGRSNAQASSKTKKRNASGK